MSVENGDLDVYLSFGFVLFGSFRDFVSIRHFLREKYPDVKIVFHTISPEHLFCVKKSFLTEEQIKSLELKVKEAKK